MDCNYIIRIRDTAYDIVGPFSTQKELAEWGAKNQADSDDDPRWQSIYLADPHHPPRVQSPDESAPWPTRD